jgi:hypothetical protein
MPSLFDERDRAGMLGRLQALTPGSRPGWGSLTVERMVCHLSNTLRMAHGELAVRPPRRVGIGQVLAKYLFLYVLPMPRNLPSSTVLRAGEPADFERERAACADLVRRFATSPRGGKGPSHPFFGVLTRSEWAVLQWRHLDHHLRQFGA